MLKLLELKTTPYQRGDRIILHGEQSGFHFYNEAGVIIGINNSNSIIVELDREKEFLHDASGRGRENHCFNINYPRRKIYEYDEEIVNEQIESMKNRLSRKEISSFMSKCCQEATCSECRLSVLSSLNCCSVDSVENGTTALYNTFLNVYKSTDGGNNFE